jgi:hypothetical protein
VPVRRQTVSSRAALACEGRAGAPQCRVSYEEILADYAFLERDDIQAAVVFAGRSGLLSPHEIPHHRPASRGRHLRGQCTTLPGCISQGATRQEALTNIQHAIGGYLASLKKHGERV